MPPAFRGLGTAQALLLLLAILPVPANAQPAAPTGLDATPGDASATLTWTNPSDSTITGYSYSFATSAAALASASWNAISGSGATTTSHTVPGLANGTRYHFRLRATNADGDGSAAQATIQLAATPGAAVALGDATLRGVVESALGKSAGAALTQLDMAKLRSLGGSGVADLTGMEHAVNLGHLNLQRGTISDISALGSLTSLTSLSLLSNAISDVSALGALTSLTSLNLGYNAASDLSPLGTLTALTRLVIHDNGISDISPLGALTSLTWLTLSSNDISDVSALGALTSLTSLNLGANDISDVSALGTLTSLTRLILYHNTISDVSALGALTSLTDLSLFGNTISDVSALGTLASLEWLSLSTNAISDVSALGALTSLTSLWLSQNAISDISGLGTLTSLTRLYLSDNDISDISALGTLSSLRELYLSRNAIADISALDKLTSLTDLWLLGNPLDARSLCDHIPALQARGVVVLFDAPVSDPCGTPPAPDMAAAAREDGRVALRWTPTAGSSYELRHARVDAELGDWTAVVDEDAAAGSHMVEGLAGGFVYAFELRAVTIEPGPAAREEVTLPASPRAEARIESPGLAAGVAKALGKAAAGTFTRGELATVTTLDLSRTGSGASPSTHVAAAGAAVANLAGVELLVNLRRLNLDGNAVRDLAPLLALRHLEWVSVRGQALTSDSVYSHIPALQARGVEVLFDAPVIVAIADAGLRGSVERTLGKSGGATLTQGDLLGLRTLDATGAGVADLSGIEMAVHLDSLDLSDNELADVSALSGLAELRTLLLGGNVLADISPLSNLAGLRALILSDNELEDVSALSGLVALEELWLADNRLADLTPLAGLTSLRYLHLGGNLLTSLAPVLGLRSLAWLDAADNRVAEVRPDGAPLQRLRLDDNLIRNVAALANSRLGEGDMVGLRGNPLSAASIATHVPALRERGVAVLAGRPVPLFPSAANAGRVGFVRVLNRSNEAGEVFISAVDDAGERFGPVRLAINAKAAAHFDSGDLESGNAIGLREGVGAPSVAGNWRLELLSTLDIAVLAYIRTSDGFLTAVHDTLPRANGSRTLHASFFNPGRNRAQRSVLRLLNPGTVDEPVSVWGVDDSGAGKLATGLTVPSGGALTVEAAELERPRRDERWRGLGRGQGKWRLRVSARWPVEAASLLESPSGHLANLSAPPRAEADGTWRLPLFPAAGDAAGREGFLRVANRSMWAGEVRVSATDDGGHRVGPVALALDASATAHLNSGDLERGNAAKGLPEGVGAPTRGDWRLALASDLNIQVASYVRHADGFVTDMHSLAPWGAADSAARVVFFHPANNRNQSHQSLLRLINDGAEAAKVVIAGVDDAAEPGGEARVTVPAGEAMTISADQLENGNERLEGALGDGDGNWRLTVTADRPIAVMSLLESPTGHLSNLSGDGGG